MKTTIHTYRFDLRIPSESAKYKELCETLRATPGRGHWMESHGGGLHYQPRLDGVEVTLETEHLFDNQWNTKPIGDSEKGLRVFDWAQDYNPNGNPNIKQGHYLDITPEMAVIRANTFRCGYCGKQEPKSKGLVFCPHCLDSEYLTSKNLRLTRMRACSEGHKYTSPELSEEELAQRLPLFKAAQTHGNTERGRARIAERLKEITQERDKAIKLANTEHDGLRWLIDRGINVSNCIFYKHTGRFCFGWREQNGIDPAVLGVLKAALVGFPFEFDIKGETK